VAASGLRIGAAERGQVVEFFFDGSAVRAYAGESVACALFARTASMRGMFCLMGSCQECVVEADGRRVAACQEAVRAGLEVRSAAQDGTR
jgi:D-hydroxyproline dehydrogenase subunit gamma